MRSEDTICIAENLLAGASLPGALRDLLLHRAAGNPFFMEEIVRALIASGALVRSDTDQWHVTTAAAGDDAAAHDH